MSEFRALLEAAAAMNLSSDTPELPSQARCDAPETIRAARDDVSRLRGKQRLAFASVGARREDVRDRVETAGDVLEDFVKTAEKAVLRDHMVTYITQAQSLNELFNVSSSRLSAEQSTVKDEALANLQRLRELELELSSTDTVIRQKEEEIRELRGEWERVFTQMTELNVDHPDAASDAEENSKAKKLKDYVYKIEQMRQFMMKFLPITNSSYDWTQDNANLVGLFAGIREPITVESLTKD